MTKEEKKANKQAKAEVILKKNISAMLELMPSLSIIVSEEQKVNQVIKAQKTKDGDNIILSEDSYYPKSYQATIKQHFEDFDNYFYQINLDALKLSYSADPQNKTLYKQLFKLSKKKTSKRIKLTNKERFYQSRRNFILFGLGLGKQIKKIIEEFKPLEIHIFETNVSLWQLAANNVDWLEIKELTEKYNIKLRAINLSHHSLDSAKSFIFDHFVFSNKPSVNGFNVYLHKEDMFFKHLLYFVLRGGQKLFISNGYVSDENKMYYNSFVNLTNNKNYYLTNKKTNLLDQKVIIAASGPSIENNYKLIKEASRSALIFSCGTGLSGLLKNGITPDFHFEIENTKEVYNSLERISQLHDIRSIKLIASTTVNPRVCELFDKSLLVLRSGPGVCQLLSHLFKSLFYPEPSVANLALSFGLEMGFYEYYLFGCDFGTSVKNKHHSKDVIYYNDETLYKKQVKEDPAIEGNFKFTEERYGNFGKKCYTNLLYAFFADPFKNMSQIYAYAKIYNASDGIRVEGTTPKLPSTISLEPLSDFEKQQAIDIVLTNFNSCQEIKDEVKSKISSLYDKWHEVEKKILDILDKEIKSVKSKKELQQLLEDLISPLDTIDNKNNVNLSAVNASFRGSLSKLISFLNQFIDDFESDDEQEFFGEVGQILKQNIVELIDLFNESEKAIFSNKR